MHLSRRQLFVAGAAALAAGLTACSADQGVHVRVDAGIDPANPANPAASGGTLAPGRTFRKVAMIGDSITKASLAALDKAFSDLGFTDVTIDGVVNRRIAVGDGKNDPLSGEKVMKGMLDKGLRPDVWVIALGTNDVGSYKGADEYATLIDGLLSMPPAADPIVWVDVYRPDHLDATKVFNLVLRDRARARGNVRVVSWFDKASDPKQTILRKDHVHPNDAGTVVFAGVVAGAFG